jgi:hypothetical protein
LEPKVKELRVPFDLNENYVVQAEEKLSARLPESYRCAMIVANGGEVATEEDDWRLYPILDSSDKKRLARTCNDIVAKTRACADWLGFPAQSAAIGGNGSGDQLVLIRNGDKFEPAVYVWSHETSDIRKAADDFSDLERL